MCNMRYKQSVIRNHPAVKTNHRGGRLEQMSILMYFSRMVSDDKAPQAGQNHSFIQQDQLFYVGCKIQISRISGIKYTIIKGKKNYTKDFF